MYEVLYQPYMEELGEAAIVENILSVNVSAPEMSVVLMNLEEYVNYIISVRAYTSVGEGPYSEIVMAMTNEDGKHYILLYFKYVESTYQHLELRQFKIDHLYITT